MAVVSQVLLQGIGRANTCMQATALRYARAMQTIN